MDKQHGKKELEVFEEGPEAEISIDFLRTTLKEYQIGKRQNAWIQVQ